MLAWIYLTFGWHLVICRTEIEWYPGKCLTQKVLKKKPKKGSKNNKPITKTENCESFFNFFSPPQVPEEDEDIDEDAVSQSSSLCLRCLIVCVVLLFVVIYLFFLLNRPRNSRIRWNKIMTLGEFITVVLYHWSLCIMCLNELLLDVRAFCNRVICWLNSSVIGITFG